MAKQRFLFTSESVTEGHPDKLADQISDAEQESPGTPGTKQKRSAASNFENRSIRRDEYRRIPYFI